MSTFDEGCGDPAPSRRDVVKYGTAALAAAAVPALAAADLVVNLFDGGPAARGADATRAPA